ncbi:hypothetical protein PQX77_009072 [Marasmius sp. AFHP31]|nr:hypothetical protein PQX77_009072 [Marasmius sp. AFHP31]
MDVNPPNVSQPFVTTRCWQVGPQLCNLIPVSAVFKLCALFLAYGIHLVLSAVCISVLRKRRQKRFHVHSLLVTALFVLATCGFVLGAASAILTEYASNMFGSIPLVSYGQQVSGEWTSALEKLVGPQGPHPDAMLSKIKQFDSYLTKMDRAWQAILVTSNLVTDIILIWRCYTIWGSRRRIVLLPALLCLFNNAVGYLTTLGAKGPHISGEYLSFTTPHTSQTYAHNMKAVSIYLICFLCGSCVINLLLTVLIAGRVIYISRQVAPSNQRPITRMYRTTIHGSIESGVLYPIALLAYTVVELVRYGSSSAAPLVGFSLKMTKEVLRACLISTMGIASTLIIVRIVLGIAINDEKSFRATVLGEGDGGIGGTRGIIESVLDVRRPEESVMSRDEERVKGSEHAQKNEDLVG